MVNQCISTRRRQQCRPHLCLSSEVEDEQLARLGAYASGSPKSADAEALESIVHPDLQAAFRQISPPRRLAVYLADVEDLSYREIAETLGDPCGHRDVAHPQGAAAAALAAAAAHTRAAHSVTARHRRGGSRARVGRPAHQPAATVREGAPHEARDLLIEIRRKPPSVKSRDACTAKDKQRLRVDGL
jgi:hypothetical protein